MKTKKYDFFTKDNQVLVKYLDRDKIINLSNINIEIIGIAEKKDDGYFIVTIVTQGSIQKLKHQVSEAMEVIGFVFETISEALDVQNFILIHLDRSKRAQERKESHG